MIDNNTQTLTYVVVFSCVQWLQIKGNCSFCWYWWNCWPSLFKPFFHKSYTSLNEPVQVHVYIYIYKSSLNQRCNSYRVRIGCGRSWIRVHRVKQKTMKLIFSCFSAKQEAIRSNSLKKKKLKKKLKKKGVRANTDWIGISIKRSECWGMFTCGLSFHHYQLNSACCSRTKRTSPSSHRQCNLF